MNKQTRDIQGNVFNRNGGIANLSSKGELPGEGTQISLPRHLTS